MAKETKEQRELRNAEENRIALAAKEAFKATMPARLMKLQVLASEACVSTRVLLTPSGPAVEFTRHNYSDHMNDLEDTLTYDTEEWEVDHLERLLNSIKEEINERHQRRVLAENLWKDLPESVRTGLKENIANFR